MLGTEEVLWMMQHWRDLTRVYYRFRVVEDEGMLRLRFAERGVGYWDRVLKDRMNDTLEAWGFSSTFFFFLFSIAVVFLVLSSTPVVLTFLIYLYPRFFGCVFVH